MYDGVGVGDLVIRLVVVILRLPVSGVRVCVTGDGKARDDDLLAVNNLWTGGDGGAVSLRL